MTQATALALLVLVCATLLAATHVITGGEWLALTAGGAVALPARPPSSRSSK